MNPQHFLCVSSLSVHNTNTLSQLQHNSTGEGRSSWSILLKYCILVCIQGVTWGTVPSYTMQTTISSVKKSFNWDILLKKVSSRCLQELKTRAHNNWNCKHPRKWMCVCMCVKSVAMLCNPFKIIILHKMHPWGVWHICEWALPRDLTG